LVWKLSQYYIYIYIYIYSSPLLFCFKIYDGLFMHFAIRMFTWFHVFCVLIDFFHC
jgi:hypothetical protein